MSIIHEALKKASREEAPGQKIEGARKFTASVASAFPAKDAIFLTGVVICSIGIGYLAYFGRDVLSGIYTSGRIQNTGGSSLSGVLPPSSAPPVGSVSSSATPPRSEPATPKNSAVSREKSGVSYLEQGKLAEAEQEFLSAASLDPESSVIQNNLGLVLKRQGRDREAESRYQSALRLDPKNVQAMNNLGLLYEQQNRVEEAKRLYQEAIMTQPNFPDPHLNFAILLERAGYFELSKRHFQSFLSFATRKDEQAVQLVKKHLIRLP